MDQMHKEPERDRVSTVARAVLLTLAIVVISGWLLLTPGGLLGKADAVGYAVCHRIDLRSFHFGDRTLPLCSRCTGMYLGALFTLIAFVSLRGKSGSYPSRTIRIVLILFAIAWAIDGLNSFLSVFPESPQLYTPQNGLRLITGTMIGVSLATMIYPIFNQTAWEDWQTSPVIPTWRWFMGLVFFLALLILGVLSENALVLYPLAILSSVGVLTLLTTAYSVLTLSLFRRENQARTWRDLWFPILGAFILALLQVASVDFLRFLFTGTWDGFHL